MIMDIFKCGICFERYDEEEKRVPRTLTECGHTICEICALKLLKNEKVVCPFDRVESKVNGGNIESLKKNYAILEAIQEQFSMINDTEIGKENRYENEQTIGIPCDENSSHIAVLYCTKCEAHYCKRCSIISHSYKTQSSHKMVKVSEKPDPLLFCSFHPSNVAELYCLEKDCEIKNKMTCANCHLYGAHKSHKYKTIEEVFNEKMNETSELMDQTNTNIEIVRSYINDIRELTVNPNEDNEYIDAKNKIDEIYEERLNELNKWKQSNMEILKNKTNAKIGAIKKEEGYYLTKLRVLQVLKREFSNTTQLKKSEYFEKLGDIEIIMEKLKYFGIQELEKRSMNPLVEYPNVITFEKQTFKGKIAYYSFNTEPMEGLCERIKQLGGIEYFPRKFQLEDQQIELLCYNMLRDCKNIEIKVFVIMSFPYFTTIQKILGERREKMKTDGLIIFGQAKKFITDNMPNYWNNHIPEIASYFQVPLLFANHEDSKFVDNILEGNHLENPYFEIYP